MYITALHLKTTMPQHQNRLLVALIRRSAPYSRYGGMHFIIYEVIETNTSKIEKVGTVADTSVADLEVSFDQQGRQESEVST